MEILFESLAYEHLCTDWKENNVRFRVFWKARRAKKDLRSAINTKLPCPGLAPPPPWKGGMRRSGVENF
jgi:hypothetical protein